MITTHERFDADARDRQINDEMFRRRSIVNPTALTLVFWQQHPVTLDALASTTPRDRILDFGCGTGEIDIHLARSGRCVVGLDLSPVALTTAHAHVQRETADVRARVEFHPCTASAIPFPDQSFDVVLCSHVLEHIPHPTPALKEIARVLRPGGRLLLYVPHGLAYYDPAHVHFFQPESLAVLLRDLFDDVTVTTQTEHQQLKAVCTNSRPAKFPRVIAQLRVKNEDRWLREVLDSVARVADGIVVLDDGSTDMTPWICREHPAVIEYVRQEESTVDEVRDRNRLLGLTLQHRPDWVLCMDGDEVLESSAPRRLFAAMRDCPPDVAAFEFEFLYLWNRRDLYRVDGIYDGIFHPRLFRLQGQSVAQLSHQATPHGGNSHGGSVPNNLRGRSQRLDLKVEHLGYMLPEDRRRKYEWYKRLDPRHAAQNYYEHLLDQPTMQLREWRQREVSVATAPPPAIVLPRILLGGMRA